MGLFGPKKKCAICGGDVGTFSGYGLANDLHICKECVAKCTPGAKNTFKYMSPDAVEANMEVAAENRKKGTEQFRATAIFYGGSNHSTPIVEVDETHGWLMDATSNDGWVYDLNAVSSTSMHLNTYDVDADERSRWQWAWQPSFYNRFPDLPRVQNGQRIGGATLELRFLDNELLVTELSIDAVPGWFTDQDDYIGAFECCNDFIAFMRDYRANKSAQKYSAPATVIAAAPVSEADNMDAIKKLHDLLEAGILSQEEYDAKKKQLLGL